MDDATRKIDSYVTKVKSLPEVEAGYMTLGDWIDGIAEEIREDLREEVTKEVMEEVTSKVTEEVTSKVTEASIKNTIEIYCEYHASKNEIVDKVRIKFPKYADKAEMYVDKYWRLDKE